VRVALRNIAGVQSADVSLSKGAAVATLSAGNVVRYEQLLQAIEKNGFVVKGATVIVNGTVAVSKDGFDLQISGSNERLKLEAQDGKSAGLTDLLGKSVEVVGAVPEISKGKKADVILYTTIEAAK
jgi:copper chaperone CopZ